MAQNAKKKRLSCGTSGKSPTGVCQREMAVNIGLVIGQHVRDAIIGEPVLVISGW